MLKHHNAHALPTGQELNLPVEVISAASLPGHWPLHSSTLSLLLGILLNILSYASFL